MRSPQVVRFNIFDYHMRYREVDWADAIPHDIDVLTGWLESSQALVLGLLGHRGTWCTSSKWCAGERQAHPISAGRATDPATGEPLAKHSVGPDAPVRVLSLRMAGAG